MTLPVPKYAIGDRVLAALFNHHVQLSERCPDCLGTREWSVTTPAGETFQLACGTCRCGYESIGTITRWGPCSDAEQLTIGSVRIDTNSDKEKVSYMCVETGVGSGSVYTEDRLHSTRESALAWCAVASAEWSAAENKRHAGIEQRNKRDSRPKPSLEQRVIADLRKQLAELQAKVSP